LSRISDGQFHAAIVANVPHRNAAIRLVVLDGVVGEIQEKLLQPVAVTLHGGFIAPG